MKLGIALPYNGAKAAARSAQLAEEAGWDGIFLGDAIWCEDPMISLTAAAMKTSRIRLGITIIPVPLRRPWKLASESVALDLLSDGRLILGLATGAVWMGWQGFPDEVTAAKSRGEMLDETIDILTLLYQRKPFDYDGKHYHLKLTLVDEMHYPPKPAQQPRIPLWVVGIWPYRKTIRRAMKGDGIIVETRSPDGGMAEVTPADIAGIKTYIAENRTSNTPYDIVNIGKTLHLDQPQVRDTLQAWAKAGTTWWIEGLWEEAEETVIERLHKGPPDWQ
jgi:alkanesulfonate monooxygenase SsuD/methylene tetrahydromethanopterin reductase-like flavin-dependent oxidoreductase (luciferase family)